MKYTERIPRKKNKLGAGFYIVIASCLLIIGGASWFALSNYESGQSSTPIPSQKAESYKDNVTSYTENTPSEITPDENIATPPAQSVAESVEKEPYSSPQSTESKAESNSSLLNLQYTMPVEGKIIKKYSEKELQYSSTYSDMRLHKGIDIACKTGTPVNACANGTVISVDESQTLGTTVTIDHSAGVTVKYSAIEKPKVSVGDTVKMGDVIGNATTIPSECKDESHIHIEILRNGKYVDLSAFGLG